VQDKIIKIFLFSFLGVPATRPQIQRTPSGFPLYSSLYVLRGDKARLIPTGCASAGCALWGAAAIRRGMAKYRANTQKAESLQINSTGHRPVKMSAVLFVRLKA